MISMLNDSKIAIVSVTHLKRQKKKTKKKPKTMNPKGKKESVVGGGSDEQTEHNTSMNPGVNTVFS